VRATHIIFYILASSARVSQHTLANNNTHSKIRYKHEHTLQDGGGVCVGGGRLAVAGASLLIIDMGKYVSESRLKSTMLYVS
jgi:hypothetical protein